jgi:hypothetical protein
MGRKPRGFIVDGPSSAHFIFIPCVLFVGMILGYTFGARAANADHERRKQRAKE